MKRSNKKLIYHTYKMVACKCGKELYCPDTVIEVECSTCVQNNCDPPDILTRLERQSGFPRGWAFMETFVHADGRVYKKGIEQEELKGTLEPTEIKVHVKRHKSRRQKDIEKENKIHKLAKVYKNKKEKE